MKPIRNSCCCPTFLIALAGPWICVLGAVFVDHVVVQELTDFIWIGGHPYNDDKLKSVARILAALGEGITELVDFYSNLTPHNSQQDSQHFSPFIRQLLRIEVCASRQPSKCADRQLSACADRQLSDCADRQLSRCVDWRHPNIDRVGIMTHGR